MVLITVEQYRDDFEINFIFENRNYARICWSKNIDVGDVPLRYPVAYDSPQEPGYLYGMNMSKLTRLQRSYRWQPHLPFMPVNFDTHPFTERFHYKFDTLPIVQVGFNEYTLEPSVRERWARHVNLFTPILRAWRGQLAMAPMSVDYNLSVQDFEIKRTFPTEKKARGYYWFYRTLCFAMYANFSYSSALKINWSLSLEKYCKEHSLKLDEIWVNEVYNALCDFTHTKRAGVIVDVATTELWSILPTYQKNGVPLLMDVGHVTFHDRDHTPEIPTISITRVTGNHPSYKYPSDWPTHTELVRATQQFILLQYEDRLGIHPEFPKVPLTLPRPNVEEPGSVLHQRCSTSAWTNPDNQETVDFIQMAPPQPVKTRPVSNHVDWIEFFDKRRKVNKRIEEAETPTEKLRRESRIKDSLRINQKHSSGPSKKSVVFEWVQEDAPPPGTNMWHAWVPTWKRVKIDRKEVEDVWDNYTPSQRSYDSFHNQWDLMVLFDVSAQEPDQDYEDDDDDDMEVDMTAPVSSNQTVAYLDEVYVHPELSAYSGIQKLNSQITFLAPSNLKLWARLTIGLSCTLPLQPPVIFENTLIYIGFFGEDLAKSSDVYPHVQEFLSYICRRDFTNPRIRHLCDLHPGHTSALKITSGGLTVTQVILKHSVLEEGKKKDLERPAYILTPKDGKSGGQICWILVVFDATSVVQIIRNGWGSSSMEGLVRNLVRYGVEFRTLVPAFQTNPQRIISLNPHLANFKGLPAIDNFKTEKRTVAHYNEYVAMRDFVMQAPEARPSFRMGGILWRLAMESTANFDDVIDHIMSGPSEVGPTEGEYFLLNGVRYYDDCVPEFVSDAICGKHGDKGGK